MTEFVLVTGANKGIGYAIVEQILAQRPTAHVLLGSRDVARGAAAVDALVAANPAAADRVTLLPIDVADRASVDAAAAAFAAQFPGATLAGLVNNAGVWLADLAATCAVNVHGIKHVFDAFLPLLSSHARVVNLTSASGPMFVAKCSPARQAFFTSAGVAWADLATFLADAALLETDDATFAAAGLGAHDVYGLSKAVANSLTVQQAHAHPELVVVSCTPGFIETDMTRPLADKAGKSPAEMGMQPLLAGTLSTLKLLFDPEVAYYPRKGFFFGSDGVRSPLNAYRSPGTPAYTGDM